MLQKAAFYLAGFFGAIVLFSLAVGDWKGGASEEPLAFATQHGQSGPQEGDDIHMHPSKFYGGLKHVFAFGDSYTDTLFDVFGMQPSASDPMGNRNGNGGTSVPMNLWIEFITLQYNFSQILTFNMASAGGTVDRAVVPPLYPEVQTFTDQVKKVFMPVYSSRPSSAPWRSSDTLFTIFFGINDVARPIKAGLKRAPIPRVIAAYKDMVQELHLAGANRFLMINLPPLEMSETRAPAEQNYDLETDVHDYNKALDEMRAELTSLGTMKIYFFDLYSLWKDAMAKPSSFIQLPSITHPTGYCMEQTYVDMFPEVYKNAEVCTIPKEEYFWFDGLHTNKQPHDLLAYTLVVDCFGLEGTKGYCSE